MTFQCKDLTRKAQLLATSAAVALMLGSPAIAQDANEEDDEEVEEVVVTGSRIVRKDLNSASPLVVIDAITFEESGEIDIVELLRESPSLNSSLTAPQSALTGAPNGVGLLNLRGLGTDRTLVLVNGRRHVAGVQGSASVDTSTIPVALIERVESVTGAGSSIYGSDAVSGVVNFVLKDDFEGIDYRGQFGISDRGDAENYFGAITIGSNFDDDRGNAVLSFEYSRFEAVAESDRPYSGQGSFGLIPNNAAIAAATGRNPDAVNVFGRNPTLPISSAFGIISVQDSPGFGSLFAVVAPDFVNSASGIPGIPVTQIIDRNGNLRRYNPGIQFDGFNALGGDGIGPSPIELLIPQQDRINLNANINYDVTDWMTAFVESKFVYTGTLDALGATTFNDDIPIALDNPFIPSALRAQLDDAIARGFNPEITVSRDTLDVAAQQNNQSDRFTFRVVGGVMGEFDNGISYELSFNYGRTETNTNFSARVEDRFFAGIDAVRDPNTGEIVCRSSIDPTADIPFAPFPSVREGFLTFDPGADSGCAPINIFGLNAIDEAGAAWAYLPTTTNSELEQRDILATVSGDFSDWFELPGGPIQWAAGFEYREEESEFSPDPLEVSGLIFNSVTTASAPVEGGFSVTELFGEVLIPVLSDVTFAEVLEVSASYRFSDYSTAGQVDTYGVGLTWRPIQDITFRGSYNRAVRAPNIFELFSPEQPLTLGADDDPCNPQSIDNGSDFRRANCSQLIPDIDNYNSTDFLSAFVTGLGGGNPNLNAEKSDTWTVGAIIQPRFLPGLNITVDYYNIEIIDAIDTIGGLEIAERCVDAPTLDNDFCPLITRNAQDGFIETFRSGQQNIAALKTSGIDFTADYTYDVSETFGFEGDWGTINQSIDGLYLLENNDFPFQNFPDEVDVALRELTFPRWILNYTFRWNRDNYGFTWRVNYQSSQFSSGVEVEEFQSVVDQIAAGELPATAEFADPLRTGDAFVHDITAFYDISEAFRIRGGVNNLLNRRPFIGTLTRPANPIGRTFFVSIQGRF